MISVHHIYSRHAPSFGGSEHHTGSPYILSTPPHLAMPAQQAVVVVVVVVVRFVTGIGVCLSSDHTSPGVRFVTGIGVCLLLDHTGGTVYCGHRRVYDVRSRSHITRATICYWHRPVYVARSRITAGTICYWHRPVHVRSHIPGATICYGHRRCEITHHRGHDLCRASACVCQCML